MFKRTLTGLAFGVVLASGTFAQSFSENATCKLTNTAKNAALYEGACTVTQSQSDYSDNTIFLDSDGQQRAVPVRRSARAAELDAWCRGSPVHGSSQWRHISLVDLRSRGC